MFCWGCTIHGELGLGGIEDEIILIPRKLDFPKANEIEEIACGEIHTVIITKNGEIYSCGNNDYGQLGRDNSRKRLQLIPGLEAFVFKKVACGGSHTLAVNEWGQLFSWGCNAEGQLGLNSNNAVEHTPRMVKGLALNVIVQIACGKKHTLALTNKGDLYAWGSNQEGQLGLRCNVKGKFKPEVVPKTQSVPIAFIACGGSHSFMVTKSGAVYGWGKNTFGQLGLNDTEDRNFPCELNTLRNTKVCYIACGEEFSVFLTLDGGVFTCGAGMYGQLGHGNNANEILPRQVMELMGSTVTQISCGKTHTLALVPSRGRVYAWGLGGGGQLGNGDVRSLSTPQVVLGPWVSPNRSAMTELDPEPSPHTANDCVVKHIYCGEDQCFATVTLKKDNIPPDDCRILPPSSQILTITEEQLLACQRVPSGSPIDHDLMTYIETVFRSQACINGSFLLDNNAHYGCSPMNLGVDLDKASRLFGIISEIDNSTIQESILASISILVTLLDSAAPTADSLRSYVISPLYHGFANPANYNCLHGPFCNAVLSLTKPRLQIISKWWSTVSVRYFERLVRIHKSVVLHVIKRSQDKRVPWDENLEHVLKFLQQLNKLNNAAVGGLKVPYETFHLSELTDYIDMKKEYRAWFEEPSTPKFQLQYFPRIYICDYPFLFNAHVKTILLEHDHALQMESAIEEAAYRAFGAPLMASDIIDIERQCIQFITLNVSREDIVQDTLTELSQFDSNDFKKPLRIKFHGEEAEDVGGVKKEFFMLLLKEILDPKYGMFKQYEETRTIWFNEDSLDDEVMYELIGVLCGLVIYNFIIINLPFPLALYKKLLQEPVCLADIKDLSPILARSMQDILDYEEPDFEEVFSLNFEVVREAFGEKRMYELIPGGGKIPVTLKNKKQFVDLYVGYILNKSVESQYKAFHEGFHKVASSHILKLFRSYELMAVIIGNENYDWSELEKNATYKDGYTKNDPTIVLFWQVFHELPLEEKKKFLLFLTGSDRIPIQGMEAIKIIIQPLTDERFLPVAHTCFNLLDLPRYQTRERLRYKLLQAIQQTQGFSLV